MSGPKHSSFRLSEAQQRQLEQERKRRLEEEKRRLEEQKMLEIEQLISAKQQNLQNMIQVIRNFSQETLAQAQQKIASSRVLRAIMQTKEQMLEQIANYPSRVMPRNRQTLQAHLSNQETLLNSLNNRLKILQSDVKVLEEELELQRVVQAEIDYLANRKEQMPAMSKQITLERKSKADSQMELTRAMQEFTQLLLPYIDNPYVSGQQELRQQLDIVQQIVTAHHVDDAYRRGQIEARIKAFLTTRSVYDIEIQQNQRKRIVYDDRVMQYQSYCLLLECTPKASLLNWESSLSQDPLAELEAEIDLLARQAEQKEELDYISHSVHEVMGSLGYDLIATDFMKTAKRNVDQQIYELAPDQAINVFTSDNGSVLFEVTGISEGKRETTSSERLKLKEAMEVFCDHYDEIKHRLQVRGITLENEDLRPADEKYARMMDISTKQKANGHKKDKRKQGVAQKVKTQDR